MPWEASTIIIILLRKTLIGTWVLRGVHVRHQVVWNARQSIHVTWFVHLDS